MKTPELKPCPFCGKPGKYVCEKGIAAVGCSSLVCRAVGPMWPVSDDYLARDNAIEAWNRRATNEADCCT